MKKIFAAIILGLILIPQLAMAGDDDKAPGEGPFKGLIDEPKPKQSKFDKIVNGGDTPFDNLDLDDTEDATPVAATKPEEPGAKPTIGAAEKFDLKALRITQPTNDGNISQGTSFFNRKDANGNPVSPITAFILTAIEFLTKIIGSVAFLILIVSGIWMIVTTGNETQVNKAKDMMLYAIIGVVVAFGSYMIVTFVQGLLIQ